MFSNSRCCYGIGTIFTNCMPDTQTRVAKAGSDQQTPIIVAKTVQSSTRVRLISTAAATVGRVCVKRAL